MHFAELKYTNTHMRVLFEEHRPWNKIGPGDLPE